MKQGQSSKRVRGRNSGRRGGGNRQQLFDSNGPSVRIRGNAFQVHEKYLSLARDAASSGDRIGAENYYQHAEHYFRIHSSEQEERARLQQASGQPAEGQQRRSGRSARNGPQQSGMNGGNGAEQPDMSNGPDAGAQTESAEEGVLRTLQVGDMSEVGANDGETPKKNGQDTAAGD